MEASRTKNSKRNIIFGLLKQVVTILIPFLNKTLILYLLGAQYQGLSGLFTSILHVLNLADLGFSTAVVYLLYKPVAEGNQEQVCSIMNYLRCTYKKIGLIMLFAGLCLLPFLDKLIAGSYPSDINIYVLYVLYLLSTVVSYLFFGYKSALFISVQREDVISSISIVTTFLVGITEMIALVVTRNFYLHIIISLFGNIFNNLLLQYFSKKKYPQYEPKGEMPLETKKVLNKQIKAIFINKVGDVTRNSFDNIIISSMFGLTVVAIYSNYFYIFSALYGCMLVITHAMQASVGNSIVTESIEKNENDFYKFNFMFTWLIGFCTICLFNLYQPFMKLWMRNDNSMLLSFTNMSLFCVYFYAINLNNIRNLYLNANGFFWECRYWYIIESIGNLLLNLILGYFWGITGILIATILTIVLFNFIPPTNIVFKKYFKKSNFKFYMSHIFYFFVTFCICCMTFFIVRCLHFNILLNMLIIVLICLASNFIYWIIYRKLKIYDDSKKFVFNNILAKFIKK